tara:strand:- start:540 stop:809 length:270 start_codon:yes stop_codon:yes gene_type:complete
MIPKKIKLHLIVFSIILISSFIFFSIFCICNRIQKNKEKSKKFPPLINRKIKRTQSLPNVIINITPDANNQIEQAEKKIKNQNIYPIIN